MGKENGKKQFLKRQSSELNGNARKGSKIDTTYLAVGALTAILVCCYCLMQYAR